MKRRFVRIGLAAGALVAVVLAVLWLCGVFAPAVGEAVVETLRPIREEAARIMADKAYLESVYRAGAEKASYVAEKTLRKVYKKVGFLPR